MPGLATVGGVGPDTALDGLRITSPLITRLIIEQLILANTLHKAVISGEPHDTLERPKSVGFGVGLAFGLFGMEFIGGLLIYQASQIAAVQGCGLRAAVSSTTHFQSWRCCDIAYFSDH